MRLIILAAGRGTRLYPLTKDKPKCLVEMNGKPLLQYQIDAAKQCGIDDIVIVTGEYEHAFDNYPVRTVNNPRYFETNMVYSLDCASAFLDGDVILSYGDIIFTPEVLKACMNATSDRAVVVDKGWYAYWCQRFENPLDDAESLSFDAAGHIVDIGNKVDSLDSIQAQYIGLMKFSGLGLNSLLESIARAKKDKGFDNLYMTGLLQQMIHHKLTLVPVMIERGWFEFDNMKDLEVAQSQLEIETV